MFLFIQPLKVRHRSHTPYQSRQRPRRALCAKRRLGTPERMGPNNDVSAKSLNAVQVEYKCGRYTRRFINIQSLPSRSAVRTRRADVQLPLQIADLATARPAASIKKSETRVLSQCAPCRRSPHHFS